VRGGVVWGAAVRAGGRDDRATHSPGCRVLLSLPTPGATRCPVFSRHRRRSVESGRSRDCRSRTRLETAPRMAAGPENATHGRPVRDGVSMRADVEGPRAIRTDRGMHASATQPGPWPNAAPRERAWPRPGRALYRLVDAAPVLMGARSAGGSTLAGWPMDSGYRVGTTTGANQPSGHLVALSLHEPEDVALRVGEPRVQ
jgi:hypothetical protein